MGELFALLAALSWTVAAYGFRHLGGQLTPLQLNFWKGVLACFGLAVFIALSGQWIALPARVWTPLLLSGLIGIALGDTLLFSALNRIGERTTLTIAESAAPLFTIGLGMLWLGEFLTLWQWLGAALILPALFWVLEPSNPTHRNHPLSGLSFAIGAALCQALGIILTRQVFLSIDLPASQGALLRIAAGVAVLPLVLRLRNQPIWLRLNARQWLLLVISTFLGTLLGIWFQQLAVKHAEAGVVQTLIATCAIMAFAIDRLRGNRASNKAWVGLALAFSGVALIALS
ncbi:DMT family transporter [Saccharospirillum mangrovi]|uniref:DMT family transporter n=1 Tax=Saccharospirillum mangrovi TaxID=2161747 RepID=UPI000D38A25E|nr:DMT family transporter [Saccharospirillum mangrovi]